MITDSVKCAVVGLGVIGSEHADVLAGLASADLIVCCDVSRETRDRVPSGAAFTTDLGEALDTPGLEAVFVCTPENLHRTPIEAALSRGLAVFCEKPLASTVTDVDEIIRTARTGSGLLVVGHLLRFDPRYIAVSEAVNDGRVGRAVHIFARRNCWAAEGRAASARTTLPLYVGVHDLDIFRWLAGEIQRVYGEGSGTGVLGEGVADTVVATVRFTSGAVGLLELSWGMPNEAGIEWDSRLHYVGTSGSAFVDMMDTGISIFTPRGPQFPDTTYWPTTYGAPSGILRTEDEHFLRLVRGQGKWPMALEDAKRAVVAALALDRSIVEHRPVDLTELE